MVVVVDDAGDVEADEDDEDENDSLSFSSPEPETGVLICSSLAAARVSARIGFAFASMSPEEFSDVSVDEDSLEQLRVSGTVVESGYGFEASCMELNFDASHCASLCT